MQIEKRQILHTDVLIIGGGTAGCYAALTLCEQTDVNVIIAEKANIRRSGCLAAGVNALTPILPKDIRRSSMWITQKKMPKALFAMTYC